MTLDIKVGPVMVVAGVVRVPGFLTVAHFHCSRSTLVEFKYTLIKTTTFTSWAEFSNHQLASSLNFGRDSETPHSITKDGQSVGRRARGLNEPSDSFALVSPSNLVHRILPISPSSPMETIFCCRSDSNREANVSWCTPGIMKKSAGEVAVVRVEARINISWKREGGITLLN